MIEYFAEIGSNYITKDGTFLNRALNLINEAQKIGCTGVKFQYFKADQLWDKNQFPNEHKAAIQRELPFEWIPILSRYAGNRGLLFGLSVFDIESVNEIKEYVDYFKIASFEAGWFDLIYACYRTGKRLMISLGQSDKEEILEIIQKLPAKYETPIDLLHCVSKYPAEIEDCNLAVIRDNPWINGYSDHTVEPGVLLGAAALGAQVLEFHMDLTDKKGLESKHSWDPIILFHFLENIRIMEKAIGTSDWEVIKNNQDRKYKANPITGLRGKVL